MLVLGITTATATCGVALLDGGRLLVESHIHVDRSHARRLAPLVAQTLDHAGRDARDLEVVAVVGGPGSFTGLRIGVSTAKGLCLATGAALVAVPSGAVLAASAFEGTEAALFVLPSRRGEVLAAVGETSLRPVAISDLAAFADGCEVAIGPNVEAVADAVGGLRAVVQDLRASAVARLGAQRFADGETVDAASFEPDYGQAFVPSQPAAIFPVARP